MGVNKVLLATTFEGLHVTIDREGEKNHFMLYKFSYMCRDILALLKAQVSL